MQRETAIDDLYEKMAAYETHKFKKLIRDGIDIHFSKVDHKVHTLTRHHSRSSSGSHGKKHKKGKGGKHHKDKHHGGKHHGGGHELMHHGMSGVMAMGHHGDMHHGKGGKHKGGHSRSRSRSHSGGKKGKKDKHHKKGKHHGGDIGTDMARHELEHGGMHLGAGGLGT